MRVKNDILAAVAALALWIVTGIVWGAVLSSLIYG